MLYLGDLFGNYIRFHFLFIYFYSDGNLLYDL